jgi:AraC-like DNA-binding protein
MIADTLNVTAKYLSQLYKDETGKNLSATIEEMRFGKARDLLEGTDLRVADIALAVGYSNLNTFLKAFKRHYNISPSDFRRS